MKNATNTAVENIPLGRFKNETHMQLNESLNLLMLKAGIEKLGLSLLYPLYKEALYKEQDALDFMGKSGLTDFIKDQNSVRNRIFRGLAEVVRGHTCHYDPEVSAAARMIRTIFIHYGKITERTLDDKTAAIKDLLREILGVKYRPAMEKLLLVEWAERLRVENDKLLDMMMKRYGETNDRTGYRMRTVRQETDKYLRAIFNNIEIRVLTGDVTPEYTRFITELNAIITRFRSILAQSLGRAGKKNADSDSADGDANE